MGKPISATQAARNFSEIVNQVRFRRQRYTIMRGGKPVAEIAPVEAAPPRTLDELLDVLRELPSLGEDAEAFRRDVERAIRRAPRLPTGRAWA